ncbi:MAG: DUF2851 family protein [Mediterranea sp.]|jgi:hypothetical protein|nr:DUF2851 family protein [Mediterranea sp.]
MEHLLHYVWKHKLFPLRELQTTDGLPVEVIDPGMHNSDAGPDFFNAKLRIGETMWVGNIEIHTHASDWYRHGHHSDKTYNSVILHVVADADSEVTRPDGQPIPQLILPCPEHIRTHYRQLCQADHSPVCAAVFPTLPPITLRSWLTTLWVERLQQKAVQIQERLRRCDGNWEDAFFVTLARNFGFGLNGDAFEAWAYLLPYRALDKHRDNPFQLEAFFYGMAGMLEEEFLATAGRADEYALRLRTEFRYLRHKFEIGQVLDATRWRFLRLRPESFPTIRLAQLSDLYGRADKLFSRLLEAETLADIRLLLNAHTSPYWEDHFIFGRSSPKREKWLGRSSKDLIVINTVVPSLYAYGAHKGNERMCERAGRFLEELKPENNHIVKTWADAGLSAADAADSQALIQLRKEYCDKRKCLFCRFGYEFLRGKRG